MKRVSVKFLPLLTNLFVLTLAACGGPATATALPPSPSALPTYTSPPAPPETATLALAPTPTPAQMACEDWQSWAVVPTVSERMRALYQRGQAAGNNARAFSKIGDGEISSDWFLTAFDLGESYYDLGPHQDLLPVIEHFRGSFERSSMAARRGFNTMRVLDPSESDPAVCEPGESPLACELRLHRPAFAILSLGTNQVWQPEQFEQGMRQTLDFLITANVVPVLSTKGDNLEGDHRINRTIACLAVEYEVPLWNFWAAIQPLPDHGLQADREHLTYGGPRFDDPRALQSAWTVRNLTALQTLDAVWRAAASQP